MKTILFVISLFFSSLLFSQCPEGRVWLKSQGEVDKFLKDYPNCTALKEMLIIADTNDALHPSSVLPFASIVDLTPLKNIKSVAGNVYIGRHMLESWGKETSLTSLKGLENLESIGGKLEITFNHKLETLSGLDGLKSINGDLIIYKNLRLKDASSIKNIEGIAGIKIDYNPLEALPVFHNLRETKNHFKSSILIRNTKVQDLTTFKNLEKVYSSFSIQYNNNLRDLNGLNNLKTVGKSFNLISNQRLKSIKQLKNLTTVGGFSLRNSPLKSLEGVENITKINSDLRIEKIIALKKINDFSSLKNIGGRLIINTIYSLQSISFPVLDSLKEVTIYRNKKLSSAPFLNNVAKLDSYFLSNSDSIQFIDFHKIKDIKQIKISKNSNLKNIKAFDNLSTEELQRIEISENPLLSICSSIPVCNFIARNKKLIINNNALGCNSKNEITLNCYKNYNQIQGMVSFSEEANCNENSYSLKDVTIQTKGNSVSHITSTDNFGKFNFFVPKGSYETRVLNFNQNYYTINPNSKSMNFESLKEKSTNLDFCIQPKENKYDVSVSIIPLSEPLTGFESTYKVIIENIGNKTQNVTASLLFDNSKLKFITSSQTISNPNKNKISWSFSNLKPFEKKIVDVTFRILPPPTNNINDELILQANVTSNNNDINNKDNKYNLKQVVRGSYDPNDKIVLEGSEINIENIEDYLHYTIRFQNTGNASAKFVVLKDVISDKLDISTFKKVFSSHKELISLENNKLTVRFENINLPDSTTNKKGSNGFISFKIKPKKSVNLGDVIYGKASIFFDYNPPIITNIVQTEIVDKSLSTNNEFEKTDILHITPNPSKKFVHINSLRKVQIISLKNLVGRKMKNIIVNESTIDISQLPTGVYLLTILVDKSIKTKKIVKL